MLPVMCAASPVRATRVIVLVCCGWAAVCACAQDGQVQVTVRTEVVGPEWYWRSVLVWGLPDDSDTKRVLKSVGDAAVKEGWTVENRDGWFSLGAWIPVQPGWQAQGGVTEALSGGSAVSSSAFGCWSTIGAGEVIGPNPWRRIVDAVGAEGRGAPVGPSAAEPYRLEFMARPSAPTYRWGWTHRAAVTATEERIADKKGVTWRARFYAPSKCYVPLAAAAIASLLGLVFGLRDAWGLTVLAGVLVALAVALDWRLEPAVLACALAYVDYRTQANDLRSGASWCWSQYRTLKEQLEARRADADERVSALRSQYEAEMEAERLRGGPGRRQRDALAGKARAVGGALATPAEFMAIGASFALKLAPRFIPIPGGEIGDKLVEGMGHVVEGSRSRLADGVARLGGLVDRLEAPTPREAELTTWFAEQEAEITAPLARMEAEMTHLWSRYEELENAVRPLQLMLMAFVAVAVYCIIRVIPNVLLRFPIA